MTRTADCELVSTLTEWGGGSLIEQRPYEDTSRLSKPGDVRYPRKAQRPLNLSNDEVTIRGVAQVSPFETWVTHRKPLHHVALNGRSAGQVLLAGV